MDFETAYNKLKTKGAQEIPFKSQGSDFIGVWASELLSGDRKGLSVIRVQWGNSTSIFDKLQWEEKTGSNLIEYAKKAIIARLNSI